MATWEQIFDIFFNPEFEKKSRVHDWRNYIDTYFQERWHSLPIETRLILFINAERRADSEQWE